MSTMTAVMAMVTLCWTTTTRAKMDRRETGPGLPRVREAPHTIRVLSGLEGAVGALDVERLLPLPLPCYGV